MDSCFLLRCGSIAVVKKINFNGTLDIFKIKHVTNLYEKPMQSSYPDIFSSKKCFEYTHLRVHKNELTKKVVCLPMKDGLANFSVKHEVEKK